jgi:error-prone DNA polymerase
MQVYGHVEKDSNSGVTHLMAYRLLDLSSALKQLEIKSHDFH